MPLTIQRIPNRSQSKRVKYLASWECFDEHEYLIGYVENIGDADSVTMVVQPVPESLGFTETQLKDMLHCLKLAREEYRRDIDMRNARHAERDTSVCVPVPEVLLAR